MGAIKIQAFGGMVPAVDDRLLSETAAARSENTWLYSGALTGINTPDAIRTLGSSSISKVYRIPTGFVDADHLTQATWMEFQDPDTDILRTQVVGDTFERYYFVSPTAQAKYNTKARIAAGNTGANAPFLLGIPAPASAPTITIAGGASAVNRTSAYVYTWVTAYGEEGPPSPAATATGKIDATWTIRLAAPAAGDVGSNRNITKARIYRTVTSTAGVATYYLVAEINCGIIQNGNTHTNTTIDNLTDTSRITVGYDVAGSGVQANTTVSTVASATSITISLATTSTLTGTAITVSPVYADTATDSTVSANSSLQSTNWIAPPVDLKGWVAMPNGIVAGWRANEVWFCEPYRLHAWPASYALAVDYPIVGLGVIGQSLIVCTQARPFAITGVHPSSMKQSQPMSLEPCMSRGSILSSPEGVYYASPNGLVLAVPGSVTNITRNLITKDQWQKLLGSAVLGTLRAARLGGAYYGFGTLRAGVFETTAFETTAFTQYDFSGALTGVLIDPQNERVAFNTLSNSTPCVNSFNDPWTGELFVIRGGVLYQINIAETSPTYEAFKWKSKIFQAPKKKNFGAARVFFEVPSTAPTLNPVRNTNLVQTLAADQYGLFRVYVDGTLKYTTELRTSGDLIRLPSGFKGEYWQFELEARVKILSLQVASTPKELGAV